MTDMKITLENYDDVKKQIEEFEAKQKAELERIQKEKRAEELFRRFAAKIPSNDGGLQYPTRVTIHIEYKTVMGNYQGYDNNEVTIEMPVEIYDKVFGFGKKRGR